MKDSTIVGQWEGKRYEYNDLQKSTVQFLIDRLSYLRDEHGVVGIKQSFEDEGAILADVLTMRRITELCDLDMFVKIGGCEAITDINNCVSMGINFIIAPMVETEYALAKFTNAVKQIDNTEFYLLCETKTAYSNIEEMLDSDAAASLTGIVVGRSDFTKSYGMAKSEVDSAFIEEKVRTIFTEAKARGLTTTMGGNISTQSADFIAGLYEDRMLDKIETRNVVIKLNDQIVKSLEETISEVIQYEIDWLSFKATNYNSIGNSYWDRVEVLKQRIK